MLSAWAVGERGRPVRDWEGYWERNEPLRDADEVAVPVLCLCSHDDPLLPPASTLPLSLFQNNPYFLLAMTDRGGHCGFTLEEADKGEGARERGGGGEEDGEGGNWSHVAVLEYFRVVAEFLRGEERKGVRWGVRAGGAEGQRGRTSSMLPPRRRRVTMMKRDRPPPQTQASHRGEGEKEQFTWQRSYTR